jgi:hypothetical protein
MRLDIGRDAMAAAGRDSRLPALFDIDQSFFWRRIEEWRA